MKETQRESDNRWWGIRILGGYLLKNWNATLETIPNAGLQTTIAVIWHDCDIFSLENGFFAGTGLGLTRLGCAQSKTVLEFVFQKWANFSSSLDGKKKLKSEFEMEEIHTKKGFPFRFDRKYFFIFYNWSSQNLDFNLSFSTLLPYFFTFFFKNWHVYILVFSLSLFFLIILISSIFFPNFNSFYYFLMIKFSRKN